MLVAVALHLLCADKSAGSVGHAECRVDGGSGDAAECRHAADKRARVDLAGVHGLAAGCKRGLDAAASGAVF